MLKIKSILVSLLAVAALASCSNENLEENPEVERNQIELINRAFLL